MKKIFMAVVFCFCASALAETAYYGRELKAEYYKLPFIFGKYTHQVVIYAHGSIKLASISRGTEREARAEIERYNQKFASHPEDSFTYKNASFVVNNGGSNSTHAYISETYFPAEPSVASKKPVSQYSLQNPDDGWKNLPPIPAKQNRDIIFYRMKAAVDSTKFPAIELFPYVNQLEFPELRPEEKTQALEEITKRDLDVTSKFAEKLLQEARAYLNNLKLPKEQRLAYPNGIFYNERNALIALIDENVLLSEEFVVMDFVENEEFREKIYDPYIKNTGLRNNTKNDYREKLRSLIDYTCLRYRDTDPLLGLHKAIEILDWYPKYNFDYEGTVLRRNNINFLTEPEFVYAYNKVAGSGQELREEHDWRNGPRFNVNADIDTPSKLYQSCFVAR